MPVLGCGFLVPLVEVVVIPAPKAVLVVVLAVVVLVPAEKRQTRKVQKEPQPIMTCLIGIKTAADMQTGRRG